MTEKEDEMDALSDMLETLVDLLIKKGLITEKEWDEELKRKLKESEGLLKFRDLKE
jgi:hypothetical protein